MWSACHPKSEQDLSECSQLGKSLSRLTQPSILAVLAKAKEPQHGYLIIQEMANGPMYGGNAPDPTGVYRILKQMENNGYVTSEWDTSDSGPAKRVYTLTDEGRAALRRWIDALACYSASIQELRVLASDALDIEVPDLPVCLHDLGYDDEDAEQAEKQPA